MRCPLWTTRTVLTQRTSTAVRWLLGALVRPNRWTHAPSSGTANCGGRRCTVWVMSAASLYARHVSISLLSAECKAWMRVRVSVMEFGCATGAVRVDGRSGLSESERSASAAGRGADGSRAVRR